MEKPVAATQEQAQGIVDVVEKTGITLLVTHTGLFHPAFERILEFIERAGLAVLSSRLAFSPDG